MRAYSLMANRIRWKLQTSFPVCIMHESQVAAINYNDTYVYGVSECVPSEEKEEITFPQFTVQVEFPSPVKMYRSPGIGGHSLRAPPAMILGC